jgi:hypothetical protein
MKKKDLLAQSIAITGGLSTPVNVVSPDPLNTPAPVSGDNVFSVVYEADAPTAKKVRKQSKTGRLSLDLDPELMHDVRYIALLTGRTNKTVITAAICAYLAAWKKDNPLVQIPKYIPAK